MQSETTFLQIVIKFAFIMGMCTIALRLVGFITNSNISYSWIYNAGSYLVILICTLFAMKSRKKDLLNGYITYGQALGTGVLVSLFAGLLIGGYQMAYQKFIDPEFFDRLITETKRKLIEDEYPEYRIEMNFNLLKKMNNSLYIFFTSLFVSVFM